MWLPLILSLLSPASESDYAIVGATVIDVSGAEEDREDAVVLLRDGRIEAIGSRQDSILPSGVRVLDAEGRYLIPGLIDSFAAINDQRHADAYVYCGVTSIIGVSGGRRGDLFTEGAPSPAIFRLESIASRKDSLDAYLAQLERYALEGVDVVLLMYELKADELRVLTARAHELGLATIGELGNASYEQGAELGLDAYVHSTRYSLDIAPPQMRQAVAAEPFSDELDSAKWRYYLHLAGLPDGDARIDAHAKALAHTGVALIPTFSLLYLDYDWSQNPWNQPIAGIIEPGSIHRPADPHTGKHSDDEAHMQAYARVAEAVMRIEKANLRAGCHYLAGSGTDVWGSMPGISLHTELEALGRAGLSPREALRAATSAPCETFGWQDRGRIEVGRRADLVLLDRDPREEVVSIDAIDEVFLAGERIDRAALLKRQRGQDGEIVGQRQLALPIDRLEQASRLRPEDEHLGRVDLSEITYLSDGLRVRAMLATPRDEAVHPAMIYCRGGNRDFGEITDERAWRFLATVASWGYVVVAPQYRGNHGGEGREEFGGADVRDVLNLLPLLEAHPRADERRIGIYGGSRGGMMALLTLRQSKAFRAAIFRGGLTDLVSWRVERPGIETVFQELIPGYTPEDDGPLIERSAIYWVDELPKTTPILWIHGTADWRVTPQSALRFAGALQEARHPYRLVMFEGADHSLSGHWPERDRLVREWLDRFVRDKAPAPDMQPHGD